MTQLLEDLARLSSMCFLAIEVPAVLPEASLWPSSLCYGCLLEQREVRTAKYFSDSLPYINKSVGVVQIIGIFRAWLLS